MREHGEMSELVPDNREGLNASSRYDTAVYSLHVFSHRTERRESVRNNDTALVFTDNSEGLNGSALLV